MLDIEKKIRYSSYVVAKSTTADLGGSKKHRIIIIQSIWAGWRSSLLTCWFPVYQSAKVSIPALFVFGGTKRALPLHTGEYYHA